MLVASVATPVGWPVSVAAEPTAPVGILADVALDAPPVGFGAQAPGTGARTAYVVTNLADTGPGSLRAALALARANGSGDITFAIPGGGGTLSPNTSLSVPPNTTIAGPTSSPGVTIDGRNIIYNGVLNVYASGVVIRNLRIRDAGLAHVQAGQQSVDGIQIIPKRVCASGASAGNPCNSNTHCGPVDVCLPGMNISDVWIDHVSVTNSADEGIEVAGCVNLTGTMGCDPTSSWIASNVTISNSYVAGNGTCTLAMCPTCTSCGGDGTGSGGGSLLKYGATRVSVFGNFWDKNYRRNPRLQATCPPGSNATDCALVDIRSNLITAPQADDWVVVAGTLAKGNVVGNYFEGSGAQDYVGIASGPNAGQFFASSNSDPTNTRIASTPGITTPFAAPAVPQLSRDEVFINAGALPRDGLDAYYTTAADYSTVHSTLQLP
jgi:hypothetical protein